MTTIDRLRELEQAATPGPWYACTWDPMEVPHVSLTNGSHHPSLDIAQRTSAEDAALIAEARNHLSALLDVAEAARSLRPDDLRYVAVDGIEYPPDSGEARARKLRAALARLEA